jgi:ribosome-associated heat shock protein Hsp15
VSGEDDDWQRLDKWLWCARFMKSRSECAKLVGDGSVRVNRQVTEKAHAKLRVGDVLTLPVQRTVRVVRVTALAKRRGPAEEARALYCEVFVPRDDQPAQTSDTPRACNPNQTASYAKGDEL